MNIRHLICIGTVFASAIYFGGVAQGASSLVITENSSTSLTATLDGASLGVINNGANLWFVSTPLNGQVDWVEPDNPTAEVNVVQGQGDRISVASDLLVGFGGQIPNGGTDTTHFTGANGAPINVTFIDNGDGGTGVPDIASTLPLLGLSLGALGLLKRKVS